MAAQQMIEKALLPVRLGNSKVEQLFPDHVAERLNPTGQRNCIHLKGCKEMHVIGHDDIAPNGSIMFLCPDTKAAEPLVDFVSCQNALTFVRVECDEVKRSSIVKQADESGRSPRPSLSAVEQHNRFLIDRTAQDQLDFTRSGSHGTVSPCE